MSFGKVVQFKDMDKYIRELELSIGKELPKIFLQDFADRAADDLRDTSSASSNIPGFIRTKRYGRKRMQIIGPGHWFIADQDIKPKAKWIPIELIQAHESNPGETVGMKGRDITDEPQGWVEVASMRPSKVKGFVSKAQKRTIKKLQDVAAKAFIKSQK